MSNFERDVVFRCIHDKDFCIQVMNVMESKYIESEYLRWIFDRIRESFPTIPTVKILLDMIEKERRFDEKEKSLIGKIISKSKRYSSEEAGYGLAEVAKHIMKQKFRDIIGKSIDKAKGGDIEAAVKDCLSGMLDISTVKSIDERGVDVVEYWPQARLEIAKRCLESKTGEFITGFSSFDSAMILGRQQLFGIMGKTGIGKSQYAHFISFINSLRGKKICHIAFENTFEESLIRYYAFLFGFNFLKIYSHDFTPVDIQKIEDSITSFSSKKGKLRLYYRCPNAYDFTEVNKVLREFEVSEGCKPDMLVIDSPDHLIARGRHREDRFREREIYWDCKMTAMRESILVAVTMQGQRDAKGILKIDNAAEGATKMHTCDKGISVNQLDDMDENELIFRLVKNRGLRMGFNINVMRDPTSGFLREICKEAEDED